MFPLGTVLFPSQPLPLHIFEPRYRAMLRDCAPGAGEFGVVLIQRGSEVGGGEVRSDVGTIAHIIRTKQLDDGSSAVLAVGTGRIRVIRWQPDDPYPCSDVVAWPDEVTTDPDRLVELYTLRTTEVRGLLALGSELGLACAPATFDAPESPEAGSFALSMLTPVGVFDQQRLLCAPDPSRRLEILGQLIDEQRLLLEAGLDPNP